MWFAPSRIWRAPDRLPARTPTSLPSASTPAGIGRGERVARRYPAQDWRR
ncbi:hypothetical protein GTV15_06940 [Streptomyces sp. SID7803]|nr:hypothetical protein [Streptomyces sp. SID7803]